MKEKIRNLLKVLPDFLYYKDVYFSALFIKAMCIIGFNKKAKETAKNRQNTCNGCPIYDGVFCNIERCEGFYCGCGCFIGVKKYSQDSSCPTNRW